MPRLSSSPQPKRRISPRVRLFGVAGLLAMAVFSVLLVGVTSVRVDIEAPGPLANDTVVVVPQGAGLSAIAETLAGAGVIEKPLLFRLYARWMDRDRSLQAGEFLFPARANFSDVLDILESGVAVQRQVTIPEGYTSLQAAAIVRLTDVLRGDVERIPDEGAILPETYNFVRGDTRMDVLERMEAAMRDALAKAWANRAPDLPLNSPQEALILASIVEKETGVAAERARVAAVFINRLRKGMRLQSDPTVAYGVAGGRGLDRPLTRSDLDTPTPYNTYTETGLPPTPIANPGRAAIEAVLNPMDTDEFYFVADGTGGHAFSKTLAEHNRNVAKWRKIERQRKQQAAE